MISHNHDPYELSTSKYWRIIHHIHGPNKELLYEFLSYKRFTLIIKCASLKHSGSETKILALDGTRARIGPMMRSSHWLLMGWTPKSLPSPQARHWVIPICHSSRNTQASLHAFKFTSKAWVIKTQQDWPINVVINSRLLACKAEIGGALYYTKLTLRVSP
jgi:hypothetical protein